MLDAAGAQYISTDAASSAEKQLSDVEQLITQGADAIIILAQDNEAILPAVEARSTRASRSSATTASSKTEAAPITSPSTTSKWAACRRGHLRGQPKGNYVFIKGNPADPNADFLRGGQHEILKAAIDCGRHRQGR